MSKAKRLLVAAFAATMCLSAAAIAGCNNSVQADDDIINGGFETTGDDWTGWTKSGTAFSFKGVVSDDSVNDVTVDKTGDYWFSGLSGGTSTFTGTLTSNTFTLSGTGKIAFKMGAAADGAKIYVEFCKADGTVLKKVTNEDYDGTFITDQLIRKIVDLSEYIGEAIYIKVTDNDTSKAYDYGYVNLDDFVMCATEDDVTKYEAERTAQLAEYAAPSFEEDETESTVRNGSFEDGLTNWKILEGKAFSKASVVSTSQQYWGAYNSYGEGDYYFDGVNNGAVSESYTGSMRSTKFTLGGDGYITFMIGAAKNKSTYVAICDGETGDELITVYNDTFNDPNLPNTLRRVYVDASAYKGKVLYIKVVDNATSDFGFINVDDFRCSLTEAEVYALEQEQYASLVNMAEEDKDGKYSYLLEYYENYDYPVAMSVLKVNSYVENQVISTSASVNVEEYLSAVSAVYGETAVTDIKISKITCGDKEITTGFDAVDMSAEGTYTVTYTISYTTSENVTLTMTSTFTMLVQDTSEYEIANGGFETGDLTGWTILTEGMTGGVISAETYWDEALPYNQAGNYHLDGWYTGIEESGTWAIRSTTFKVGGSGWMTVRMGGNAACVKVYLADGTQIGEYYQTAFSDTSYPNVNGGHWADMHTYAIDLSDYMGQQLYIELCDVAASGWAHAFFDEVITYYETAPDYANLYDTVNNSTGCEPAEVQFPWILAQNTYAALEISTAIADKIVEMSSAVDVTAYLTEAIVSYNGAEVTAEVTITKIVCGDTEITTGFDAVDMSTAGTYVVTYTVAYGDSSVSATFTIFSQTNTYQIANGGFETGDLTGWAILTDGMTGGVISDETYWGEGLPYNQSGSYHLDGWNTGIDESGTWAVRSTTFTLAGSGWITVKMGGNAACVKVYLADGTQIGEYMQTQFSDTDFPNVSSGHWADMHTYAIDLSTYLGQELYIELCDVEASGWAHAFFDEVITYYETAPDVANSYDTVNNATDKTPATVEFPWILATNTYTAG